LRGGEQFCRVAGMGADSEAQYHSDTKPLLDGLDHASHDFSDSRSRGDNTFTHAHAVSLGQHLSTVRGLGIPTIKAVLMMSTDQSPQDQADQRFRDEAARLPRATER
jgi:hypothetical protein